MSVAFVFPGQGSQEVGMGRALDEAFPESRAVFAEADAALGFSLSRLCFEGPEEDLQLTANTQPAILAASIAALLLGAGEKGKRHALPHSKILIHQPMGGVQGQASPGGCRRRSRQGGGCRRFARQSTMSNLRNHPK